MACARDLALITGTPASVARERVARVEKLNPSNALGQKPGSPDAESAESPNSRVRPRASRFETGSGTPLWYGPRLRPAFVAQVLGQVLPGSSVPSSSTPAYRTDSIPTGLLLDEQA